ncbi:M20/M25/M40 family metallo-hydrolase [Commensalibacter sp. TBRC 10068]|uniref:M20/M25/M40 family metallo-hydrolase n=1 Tax=Commensalibacter nepenthis TaxID=3043872 RepID=A0ABT6Q7R8_9PROT|nr:M20/M25/M40 family metallo-hydrolase [Commensalibacter sp. TBRC 10068]MDI2112946.1 M20/M25/M40 family metallo-hydrolase [Commensalibacter sp. TBRC 10068]
MHTILGSVDRTLPQSLEKLFALLKIPSISAHPGCANECRNAANWLKEYLESFNFVTRICETEGHPIVLAQELSATNAPHILFYGHYDVQPVDPIELWENPPFEPCILKDALGHDVIHGRGSSDDKGQILTFLEACRAIYTETGELPVRITVILEGEEESGGEHLPAFLAEQKHHLTPDMAFICDTDMATPDVPAITAMVRGLVGEEVTIYAANRDLHSGIYGNAARNPIQVLSEIIIALRDDQGRVSIPEFYEGVPEIPVEIREKWQEIGKTDETLLSPIGLKQAAGENAFNAIEQTWCRPSCEINGISGGYQEAGFKTVIPAKASAKISFRLVGQQDPLKIRKNFREFVSTLIPQDCRVEFKSHGASRAGMVSLEGAVLEKVCQALQDEWNCETAIVGSGGAIPVVNDLQREFGIESFLVGFANADDCIHSPNEKYNLRSFHKGIRSWVRILYALQSVKL